MVNTNHYLTFTALQWAEDAYQTAGSEQSQCIVWIKQVKSERYLEVTRISGIWQKIRTIGFVNTVKSWFGLGDASLRGVFAFLNKEDVKLELKRQYLDLTCMSYVTKIDAVISRLNSDARRQNLSEFTLGITREERLQLEMNISQIEAKVAENNRKYQEMRQKEEAEKHRQEEAKKKLEEESTPARQLSSILAPIPQSARSSGGTTHISMCQTINGQTTSYSGTFQGSCDVRMDNGRVTVNGALV